MPEIVAKPFRKEHYRDLAVPDEGATQEHIDKMLTLYEKSPLSYSLFFDGKPMAAVGISSFWSGVGEVWFMPGKLIYEHSFSVGRKLKKMIDDLIDRGGFFRVQCVVKKQDKRAVRFAKFLGGEIEGVLRQYGPDRSDYFIMGRIK
jgi:hypothetical protein